MSVIGSGPIRQSPDIKFARGSNGSDATTFANLAPEIAVAESDAGLDSWTPDLEAIFLLTEGFVVST
jgi:hypothetical protein